MSSSQIAATMKNSTRATYQDVLDAPPQIVAEIVDGTLYTNRRPGIPYAIASSDLLAIVGPPFSLGRGGPGGWLILHEPELHLDDDIMVPNQAGWLLERMPELPSGAYCTLVPDWVCEMLSPSTRKLDLDGIKPVCARAGVRFIWFVDPDSRLLEAFALHNKEWVLIDRLFDYATVSLPPFDAIGFILGELWSSNVLHKAVMESASAERLSTEIETELSQTAK